MRSRLLILLSLIVLLIQPITLLHGLSHVNGQLSPRKTVSSPASTGSPAGKLMAVDAGSTADDSVCLQCLALNALDGGLPVVEPTVLELLLQRALPPAAVPLPHGGTSAGYHARGPPAWL
jgi:hypothetical protein